MKKGHRNLKYNEIIMNNFKSISLKYKDTFLEKYNLPKLTWEEMENPRIVQQ